MTFTTSIPISTSQLPENDKKIKIQNESIASIIFGVWGLILSGNFWGILFSIIGLALGIGGIKKYPKHKKSTIGLIVSILALFIAICFSASHFSPSQVNNASTSTTTLEAKQFSNISSTVSSTSSISFDTSEGIAKYKSGDYLYITPADLDKYSANMKGIKIYTVATVKQKDDPNKALQVNLSDGFMFSDFYSADSSYKDIPEGTQIAILGTIDELEDLKITTVIQVKNCYVFAYGEDAAQYIQKNSDERLSNYLKTTEATANANGNSDISEDDYKAMCKTYKHNDILRNPDKYKKKYCVLKGTVKQSINGLFDSYVTLYVEDSSGNEWGCNYSYADGETHILEGDKVTLYGKLNGTQDSVTVLGKQVTLPFIEVKYMN